MKQEMNAINHLYRILYPFKLSKNPQTELLILWIKNHIINKPHAENVFDIHGHYNKSLNLLHNEIKKKINIYSFYPQNLISTLLKYIQKTVYSYYIHFNKMNYYILFEQCIRILKEIKQNFQIEPYNSFNYIEQYPNVKICKQRYEEYGRILFNYHHNNDKLPYIIRNILYILNEDNLEKSMVERKKWLLNEIYKFVDLLTSLSNDPKWLEMLYGQKIDMKKALTIHNQFCKEYNIFKYKVIVNKNDSRDNQMEELIDMFINYLFDIHQCVLTLINIKCKILYIDYKDYKINNQYPELYQEILIYIKDKISIGNRIDNILFDMIPYYKEQC